MAALNPEKKNIKKTESGGNFKANTEGQKKKVGKGPSVSKWLELGGECGVSPIKAPFSLCDTKQMVSLTIFSECVWDSQWLLNKSLLLQWLSYIVSTSTCPHCVCVCVSV